MGLAQRRISQEYQETRFPSWVQKIQSAVGFPLPIEVRWDTLVSDDHTNKDDYFAWYDIVYFQPLLTALQNIGNDQMGRDALKAGLSSVVIDGTEGSSAAWTTLDCGVLTVLHKFDTNVDDHEDRARKWQRLLEDKL